MESDIAAKVITEVSAVMVSGVDVRTYSDQSDARAASVCVVRVGTAQNMNYGPKGAGPCWQAVVDVLCMTHVQNDLDGSGYEAVYAAAKTGLKAIATTPSKASVTGYTCDALTWEQGEDINFDSGMTGRVLRARLHMRE
jgi:hypothetical protein